MLARCIRLASALAVLAVPVGADPLQHGDIILDVPPGWAIVHRDPIIILRYRDQSSCSGCIVMIGPGKPATGSFETWIDDNFAYCIDDKDRDEQITIIDEDRSEDSSAILRSMQSNDYAYVHLTFDRESRYESLCYQGYIRHQEQLDDFLELLDRDVWPMFKSVKFASDSESLLPPPAPGNLSGVYLGLGVYPLNLTVIPQVVIEFENIVFYQDGHFFKGTPSEGITRLDVEALRANGVSTWGIYRDAGDEVELTYADGQRKIMKRTEKGFDLDGIDLVQVRPVPDKTRLAGVASARDVFSMNSGLVVSANLSKTCRIFREDGTYEEVRASQTTGSAGSPFGGRLGYSDSTNSKSSGTYVIQDGLLILNPDSGQQPLKELATISPEGSIFLGELLFKQESEAECP